MIDIAAIARRSADEELPPRLPPPGAGGRGDWETIGSSREGRPVLGFRCGRGPLRVSLIAGAHADEPVGPRTLLAFSSWLASAPEAAPLLERATFAICPHVNPDGAVRNASWSRPPIDLDELVENAVREAPGDDVEFGFPIRGPAETSPDPGPPAPREPPRPENLAVARFLSAAGPFAFHASLHGMAVAEGAWFLIDRRSAPRTGPLRAALARLSRSLGLPLHDLDRRGEKGFFRIEPGFATTPTSAEMREHFERRGERREARLFRPSSMELVASLGGRPLAMVSEIPLFLARLAEGEPPGSAFLEARERLLRARLEPPSRRGAALREARRRRGLEAVSEETAAKLQLAMVLLGSGLAAPRDLHATP